MTPALVPVPIRCGSRHPQECALLLRRSVAESTGWRPTAAVLAVGERAACLAHRLAERHTPAFTLGTGRAASGVRGPYTTDLGAEALLLPTLGLPRLSLALVSGYSPGRTEQLLLDLDVLLRPDAPVLFLPSRRVPGLRPYTAPAGASAFHRLRVVRLAHVGCADPGDLAPVGLPYQHDSPVLAAGRPSRRTVG
ncbi:hypothetical protein ACWCYY_23730 [Kitasatospora sp. NPDC001664]